MEAGWLDQLLEASGTHARRVVVSDGITPLTAEPDASRDDADDIEGEVDPHIWHDVTLAMHMVRAIRDGLSAADPAHADTFRANATAYLEELEELDAWVQNALAPIPRRIDA